MAEYISFQPKDFFNNVLYNGTGSSQAVTGVGFEPGATWIKNRPSGYKNEIFDSVRGVTKYFSTNDTLVETTDATGLSAFGADGFTVVSSNETNRSGGDSFISWNWKLGTTTGIAGSPSITPTAYSFNATAGQSVIAYTGNGVAGATLPHGLGVAPEFMFTKNLEVGGRDIHVYHVSMGPTRRLYLNQNSSVLTNSTSWNDTAPTSTLFSVGTNEGVNENTKSMVAYCFASTKGYSKFGLYVGNLASDGPFIYTGFRPAFIMIKDSDASTNWTNRDITRDPFNPSYNYIYPNLAAAGTAIGPPVTSGSYPVDFLSNGFKIRNTDDKLNTSGNSYIYAAFAEFPTVSSNDVPGLAR